MPSTKILLVILLFGPLFALFVRSKNLNFLLIQFFIFLMPIASLFFPPGNGLGITFFDCFLFAGLILIFNKDRRVSVPSIYRKSIIILVLSIIVSTIFSSEPDNALIGFMLMLRFYIFYFILINEIDDFKKVKSLLFIFSIGLISIAILGFFQSFYNINFTLYSNDLNSNSKYFYSGIHNFVRVVGPFSNSLNFSNFLASGIFLLFFFYDDNRFFTILFSIFIFVVLGLTLSRVPVIVTVICILIYFYYKLNIRYIFIILGLCIMSLIIFPERAVTLLADFTNNDRISRFSNFEKLYTNSRYDLWLSSFESLDSHLLGVGLKNNEYSVSFPASNKYYILDTTPGWRPFNFHFENVYLAMFMNLGVLGFVGFLLLIYKLISANYIMINKCQLNEEKKLSLILLPSSISFALIMLTNPAIISDMRVMLLFVFVLALTQINNNICTRK